MGRAHLNFEDHDDGTVSCNLVCIDGFNVGSKAHQLAWYLMKHGDTVCENLGEITSEEST